MKKILIVFVFIIFITGCGNINNEVDKMISAKEVNKIMETYNGDADVYIIDVREIDEFDGGHLEKAINIPVGEIQKIKDRDFINEDSKIIVYCRSGNRSKIAQAKLMELGYTNVYDMGGILDWPYNIVK